MLKPAGEEPQPRGERSFNEIATQLVDDAKAYARAEVDFAKALASEKTKDLRVAAILLVAAAFVAMAALNALVFGIFVGLAMLMSPVIAGIVCFILVGAVAALIGWLGVNKLRDSL